MHEEVEKDMCPMCWMMVPLVVLGITLVIAVIALAVLVVVWAPRHSGPLAQPAQTSLDTLMQRYARGEISAEQFETVKRQLAEG